MATEQKSIEISYKADIKDLISKLEQIPTVTKKEAKAMVAALDRQLKQAEKAAKQSADAQKKVAREMAKGAQRAKADFDDLAHSADRMGGRLENVAEKSGDIDRGFSGIGLALRGVNPQLAEAADGMADTFAVVESLIMGFGALNPIILAGTAVVGGLALGYMAYTAEVEKARQTVLDLRDAQKQLNASQLEQQANLDDAISKLAQEKNEFDLLTQQIDKYEYAVNKAGYSAAAAFDGNIDAARQTVNTTAEALETVKMLTAAYTTTEAAILSEEQIKQLRTLQLQNDAIDNSIDLTARKQKSNTELLELQTLLTKQLQNEQGQLDTIVKYQQTAKDLARTRQEFENELAQANEEQARSMQKQVAAKKQLVELDDPFDSEAVQAEIAQIEARNALQSQYALTQMDDTNKQIQAVQDRYDAEYEQLLRLGVISGEHQLAQDMAHELDKERLAEIDEILNANHEKELERIKDRQKENYEGVKTVVSGIQTFAAAMTTFLEQTGRANGENTKKLFRMNQIAAIADIAFSTAEAIAAALVYPPILRGAAIATATAIGAAQTAVVASQQPPQYHMGGMAPDERSATLLTGEAVIDRTTVRNMGGPEGVRQLQNQRTNNTDTVIIQPFKHIDRYNRAARKRMGRKHTGAY